MRRAGIVHKPGLAAEVLGEMAPLLASEGIDLNDPDAIPDLDHLNAALARATEQYNMQLFTPVGKGRDLALTVLIEFTEAIEARNSRRAEIVLDSVGPEETEQRPAVSHVIGAGLGLLDNWYTDAILAALLAEVEVPKWRGPARSTAARILNFARRGDAYASLDTLITRHGGEFVLHSVALAVAATILDFAQRRKLSVLQASDWLFTHTGTRGPAGSAFGSRASEDAADLALRESYRNWLIEDVDRNGGDLEDEVSLFVALADISRSVGLDLSNPDDVENVVELTFSHPDEDMTTTLLLVLDRYLHFRLEQDPTSWNEAHEYVQSVLEDGLSELVLLNEAVMEAQRVPEEDRVAALSATRVISAVRPLLEWIGEAVPVTSTGNLRRKDLEPAAALLGIHAVGVAKLPEPTWRDRPGVRGAEPDDVVHAQSLLDVPVLASWWSALTITEVIDLSPTKAKPGPESTDFLKSPPPIESSEMLTSTFVAEVLTRRLDDSSGFGIGLVTRVISYLAAVLAPDDATPDLDPGEDGWGVTASYFEIRVLEHAGLVEVSDGAVSIPEPLRAAVGIGVIMALTYVNQFLED